MAQGQDGAGSDMIANWTGHSSEGGDRASIENSDLSITTGSDDMDCEGYENTD